MAWKWKRWESSYEVSRRDTKRTGTSGKGARRKQRRHGPRVCPPRGGRGHPPGGRPPAPAPRVVGKEPERRDSTACVSGGRSDPVKDPRGGSAVVHDR